MRTWICKRFLVVALALGSTLVQGSPITYDVSFASGVNSLVGSITTDGTIGAINAANILEWSFTSAGQVSFSISSTIAGAQTECFGTAGCFSATLSTLSFLFASPTVNDPLAIFINSSPFDAVSFLDEYNCGAGGCVAVTVVGNQFRYQGPPNVVGLATSIPEPATLALLGLGLAGLGFSRKRKSN
jgi:hypothetical protein